LQRTGAAVADGAGVAGVAGAEEVAGTAGVAGAAALVAALPEVPLVDAVPDLFTPPWWLQAPLPLCVAVVPSLQSTGVAASLADVAVSAALPGNGKTNAPANKTLHINALELRIVIEMFSCWPRISRAVNAVQP
jgi:hypothetical protein